MKTNIEHTKMEPAETGGERETVVSVLKCFHLEAILLKRKDGGGGELE